jgi:cell division transport system permease protein
MADFGYYLKEGFSGFFRNRSATFSAIAITTLILFIMSLFLIIIFNIRLIIDEVKEEFYIYVYLKEGYEDTELVKENIYKIEGIETIDYISKDEAEQEFRESFKDEADMLDILDKNYFPASYRITLVSDLREEDTITSIASDISSIDGVDEVDYGQEWVEKISEFEEKLRIISFVIGIILAIINITIISNAIKLIILGRSEKIHLSRLVGATDGFIRMPFVIEGFVIGILGGLLSSGISYALIEVLNKYEIVKFEYLTFKYIIILISGGALLGIIASLISTSVFLKRVR